MAPEKIVTDVLDTDNLLYNHLFTIQAKGVYIIFGKGQLPPADAHVRPRRVFADPFFSLK